MKSARGAVIVPVLVLMGVITTLTFALLVRANSVEQVQSFLRAERDAAAAEMSVQSAARGALVAAAQTGDFTNIQQHVQGVMEEVSLGEWSSYEFSVVGAPPQNLFSKSSALELFTSESPADGLSGFFLAAVHTLQCELALRATIHGSPISRTSSPRARLYEFSGAEFQLIASSTPFDADNSATVSMRGKALLAGGLIRSESTRFQADSTSRVLACGVSPLNESGLQVYRAPLPSWGVVDTAHLLGDHSYSTSALRQNYFRHVSLDLPNTSVLEWSDVTTPPAGLPQGITLQEIAGKTRLTINLSYWFEQGVVIRCTSADTLEAGIAIVGNMGTGNQIPAAIATNGRVTLFGSNNRPTLVATNSSHSPILLSDGYAGVPRAASSVVWRGRLVLPVENLAFDTSREDWAGAHLEIIGGLFFKGGHITGVPRIELYSDPVVRASFSGFPISSERVLFTHVSLPN